MRALAPPRDAFYSIAIIMAAIVALMPIGGDAVKVGFSSPVVKLDFREGDGGNRDPELHIILKVIYGGKAVGAEKCNPSYEGIDKEDAFPIRGRQFTVTWPNLNCEFEVDDGFDLKSMSLSMEIYERDTWVRNDEVMKQTYLSGESLHDLKQLQWKYGEYPGKITWISYLRDTTSTPSTITTTVTTATTITKTRTTVTTVTATTSGTTTTITTKTQAAPAPTPSTPPPEGTPEPTPSPAPPITTPPTPTPLPTTTPSAVPTSAASVPTPATPAPLTSTLSTSSATVPTTSAPTSSTQPDAATPTFTTSAADATKDAAARTTAPNSTYTPPRYANKTNVASDGSGFLHRCLPEEFAARNGSKSASPNEEAHIFFIDDSTTAQAVAMATSSGLGWVEMSYGIWALCGHPTLCAAAVEDAENAENNEGDFVCAVALPPLEQHSAPSGTTDPPEMHCLAVANTDQCAPQVPRFNLQCALPAAVKYDTAVGLEGSVLEPAQNLLFASSVLTGAAADMAGSAMLEWTKLRYGTNSLCGNVTACTAALGYVVNEDAPSFSCVVPAAATAAAVADVPNSHSLYCIAFNGAADGCTPEAFLPVPQTDGEESAKKDGGGTIAGVVIAVLLLLGGGLAWFWWSRKQQTGTPIPEIKEVTIQLTRNAMYSAHVPTEAKLAAVTRTTNVMYDPYIGPSIKAATLANGGQAAGSAGEVYTESRPPPLVSAQTLKGPRAEYNYASPNDIYWSSNTGANVGGGGGGAVPIGAHYAVPASTNASKSQDVVYLIPMATPGDGDDAGDYLSAVEVSEQTEEDALGRKASKRSIRSITSVHSHESVSAWGGSPNAAPAVPAKASASVNASANASGNASNPPPPAKKIVQIYGAAQHSDGEEEENEGDAQGGASAAAAPANNPPPPAKKIVQIYGAAQHSDDDGDANGADEENDAENNHYDVGVPQTNPRTAAAAAAAASGDDASDNAPEPLYRPVYELHQPPGKQQDPKNDASSEV